VPDVYPTQRGLAKGLGFHRSLIQRALDVAEAHGHITRQDHDYDWRFDGTEYRLLFWSSDVGIAHGHGPISNSGIPPYPGKTPSDTGPITGPSKDLSQVQARTYDRSQNGFPTGTTEAGSLREQTAAAGAEAAAADQLQGEKEPTPVVGPGINHSATTCVECGNDLDAWEGTTPKPGITGFRCHDRNGCRQRQAANAADLAASEAEKERKANEAHLRAEAERPEREARDAAAAKAKAEAEAAEEAEVIRRRDHPTLDELEEMDRTQLLERIAAKGIELPQRRLSMGDLIELILASSSQAA
jgi:hypothetical protein